MATKRCAEMLTAGNRELWLHTLSGLSFQHGGPFCHVGRATRRIVNLRIKQKPLNAGARPA
jgi:hypothetical protein